MEKRRVVITGMGAVTPVGNTVADSWNAIRAGECGIAPITLFDASNSNVKLAGEVKNVDFDAFMDRRDQKHMDRFVKLAMVAAAECMEDGGLDMAGENAARCGVIISSGIGGLGTIEAEHTKGMQRGFDRISPFFIPMAITNMAAGQVAIRYGFKGLCSCVVTACAGGTNAVGDAFRQIRDGYADVMLCGGAEASVTPMAMGGFANMKALHTGTDPMRASIPFDAERSGFVLGEGAGVLLIEEYEHAKARGAKIYGEVAGYGVSCDAYHITAPAPGGVGGAAAMQMAIEDAGLVPAEIGYINAHGTSTHMNDLCETQAVHAVFGEEAKNVLMSSTKSNTGHLLGAAGAVEAIFTALALRDQYAPATINYKTPDPECDLDVVANTGRSVALNAAMSSSLGFGGHNACIVLKKWEEA